MKFFKFIYNHRRFAEYLIIMAIIVLILLGLINLLSIMNWIIIVSFLAFLSIWIAWMFHILYDCYKLGRNIFVAIILISLSLFVYEYIAGGDFSTLTRSAKNSFFRLSIVYLLFLMIPLGILLYNDVHKKCIKFKQLFIKRNDVDIYGTPVIEFVSLMGIMITLASAVFADHITKFSLLFVASLIYIIPIIGLIVIDKQVEFQINNCIKNYKNHNSFWTIIPNTYGLGCTNSSNLIGCVVDKSYKNLIIYVKSLYVTNLSPINNIVKSSNSFLLNKSYSLKGYKSNRTIMTNGELHDIFHVMTPGKYNCTLMLMDNLHQSHILKFEYNYQKYIKDSYIIKFIK